MFQLSFSVSPVDTTGLYICYWLTIFVGPHCTPSRKHQATGAWQKACEVIRSSTYKVVSAVEGGERIIAEIFSPCYLAERKQDLLALERA